MRFISNWSKHSLFRLRTLENPGHLSKSLQIHHFFLCFFENKLTDIKIRTLVGRNLQQLPCDSATCGFSPQAHSVFCTLFSPLSPCIQHTSASLSVLPGPSRALCLCRRRRRRQPTPSAQISTLGTFAGSEHPPPGTPIPFPFLPCETVYYYTQTFCIRIWLEKT